jgi:LmbE family N-acetylglucosaminyl deacetylase
LLSPILRRELPQLIYLPHPGEWHPDHQAALPLLRAALERSRIPQPALRAYEVWTPLQQFDHVENISRVMPRKLRALRAHRSQLAEFDYERAMRGLNQYRGALAGKCRYAEVFQSLD